MVTIKENDGMGAEVQMGSLGVPNPSIMLSLGPIHYLMGMTLALIRL